MFRLINKLKNRKGFTLIELIVVLAVLAVIMAIAVPRFLGVQNNAEVQADESSLEMVRKAAELYFAQNPDEDTVSGSALDVEDFEFQSTSGDFDGNGLDDIEATIDADGDVTVDIK
jgi:type IV pilus assembly protein PilA